MKPIAAAWLLVALLAPRVLCPPFVAPKPEHRTLVWLPNAEPDIAGYNVYWRTSAPSNLALEAPWTFRTNVGNVTSCPLTMERGIYYYFAVTAYNLDGFESDFSQKVLIIFVP
jgi:hypothetical protein